MIRAAIIALFASPAMAATVPAFVIEAAPCGTVHTLHEDMTSAVVATERGSRRYVCGNPVNPLPYFADLDIKGSDIEPAMTARLPVAAKSAPPPLSGRRASRRSTGGASASIGSLGSSYAGASSFSDTHVHVEGCPCGCCDVTPEPPVTPVPLPAGGGLLLAAIGLLWRARR